MKAIIFFLTITFFLTSYVNGQTYTITNNPTFDSVKVIQNNDSINFIIFMSSEDQDRCFVKFIDSLGNQIHNFKVSNDSIYIYENSMWPLTCTENLSADTILFTNLNLSNYKISLIDVESILMSTCYGCPMIVNYIDTAEFDVLLSMSIDQIVAKRIISTIYPNPSTGKIKILTENVKNIFVINQIGETILNIENTNEINLDNLPKGIYFIKVTNDKFVYIEKVIIQ